MTNDDDAKAKRAEPRIVDGLPLAPPVVRAPRVDVNAPEPAANPRTKPTPYAPSGVSPEPAPRDAPPVEMIASPPRRRGLVLVIAIVAVLALLAFAVAAVVTRALSSG